MLLSWKAKVKIYIKKHASQNTILYLKKIKNLFEKLLQFFSTLWGKALKNRLMLWRNSKKEKRYLEIGPGRARIPSFETLNIVGGFNVDYVWDATKPLPFASNSFDLVYASHILEHIPWYQTEDVLREWMRILKHGAKLEIWVPNGLKICKTLVDAEIHGNVYIEKDGWYKFNPLRDSCVWTSGRIFSYGDGRGTKGHPNWHVALFTPRYLKVIFERIGLVDVQEMDRKEVRGHDHGWINLGMKGTKP